MTLTINDTAMTSGKTARTARLAPGCRNLWQVSRLPSEVLDRNSATTAMNPGRPRREKRPAGGSPALAAPRRLGRRTRPDRPRRDRARIGTTRKDQQRGTRQRPIRPRSSRAMSPHHPPRRHPGPPGPDTAAPAAASSPAPRGNGQAEPAPAAERLAYSVAEAARLTGLSRDLLYDEMRRGNLAYIKVGRRRLITRQQLQQFLGLAI
jgi:excisionase family DNA binding protein